MKMPSLAFLVKISIATLMTTSSARGGFPDICDNCWYEVPNSSLDSVYQTPVPPNSSGQKAIMEAWNGAAFDKRRSRLIIAGAGGGTDYSGNEVYAFDLDSLKWYRIKDGAAEYDEDDELYAYYKNGGAVPDSQQPRPGLTYNQIAYDSLTDNVYIFGQPFTYNNGTTWQNLLRLNLGTLNWSRVREINSSINYGGSLTAQDPTTGRIWFFGRGDDSWMADYNPSNDSLFDRGNMWTGDEIPSYQTAGVMPSVNRVLSVGGGQLNYWDIVTSGTLATDTILGTGCDTLMNATAPGFEWSPIERKMIGWVNGTHVITMDSTYQCADVAPSGGNTVTPDSAAHYGTYGRWRYSAKHNVFVLVNKTTGSVFLYRFSPDATPDTIPNPPVVVITSPSQDTTVATTSFLVRFTVDGIADSANYLLVLGNNEIIVSSTNAGGTGKDTVYIARGTPGASDPTWPSGATLSASNVKPSSMLLAWSAANDDSAVAYYQVYINGALLSKQPASPRTLSVVGLAINTTYVFRVEALDLRGNISIDGPIRTFATSSTLPAEPSTFAPQIPSGEATLVAFSTAFLYKGANAIQTGAIESVFDTVRSVVIRGSVNDRNGDSLSGITVSILGNPELGSTVTRASGQYDLVVNGGGRVVLVYNGTGYLPAQREVFTRWQEYNIVPDVTLIPSDTTVNTIVLADTGMSVARAGISIDTNGSRQATLLIPSGTSVTLRVPGGTILSPDTISLRATEYTVGSHGTSSMPGTLPGSSAYTYAVDFSIDEAFSAGATEVLFNHPIYSYLENFVGIPTGYPVPVGYYDQIKGYWVPSTDGRVIKISSISSGKANLVVDTTGSPATDGRLDSLGITTRERQKLASLYSVNQTLWRVPITHFTAYDYNYPYRLPDDAKPPKAPPPRKDAPTGKCNTESGSIINCQNQSLGETVRFPGLPSLNYRSDRTSARRWNRLEIPVTDSFPAASMLAIRLEVKVAGRKFEYVYAPDANITQDFEWDGKDAYGRTVIGKQPYSYSIFYSFPTEYAAPRNNASSGSGSLDFGPQSFGLASTRTLAPTVPGRIAYELSNTFTGYIGNEAVDVVGPGWSLETHHAYDPTSGTLHLGSGEDRKVESGLGAMYTVAGGGVVPANGGEEATSSELGRVSEMDIGPDGALYIADRDYQQIWKITLEGKIYPLADKGIAWHDVKVAPDGNLYLADPEHSRVYKYFVARDSLSVVAGTGTPGFSGDGGPATSAKLNYSTNIDIGPDGSLYIIDRSNFRLRKVSSTGIIQTIAGTGQTSFNGDSLPGPQTNMGPGSLAVMEDGSIYLSDPYTGRIRMLDVTGIITTVAGDGTVGTDGDGGPALEAQTFADRLEVVDSKQGGRLIYLSDELNNTIRVVDENGNIFKFAGGGSDQVTSGIPGTEGNFIEARGTAVDPQGNFYVGTYNFSLAVARKIVGKLPDFSNRDIYIPAMSSGEVYHFSASGRHLKTYNAFTGATLQTFGYDGSGRLTTITDAFSNVTTITRDGGGYPTDVSNAYSQSLSLDQDANGSLASVEFPSGAEHTFAYNAAGLLEAYTTPRGFGYAFTYDTLGRLTLDEDPAGGSKALVKLDTLGGSRTSLTTGMGRTRIYDLIPSVDRSEVQRNHDAAGLITTVGWSGSGSITTTTPDGMENMVTMGPEPLAKLQNMQPVGVSTTSPNGLLRETYQQQTVELRDADSILSLDTYVEEKTVNGEVFRLEYSNPTRSWISTSSEGRKDTVLVDSLGRILQRFVSGAETIEYGYDSHGRLETISQGAGAEERETRLFYNSSGYLEAIRNPLGDTTTFEYDADGRIVKEIRPGGAEVEYGYDADGNIDSLAPPGKPTHAFQFNSLGADTVYAPPSLGAGLFATSTGYNLDHQMLAIRRPDSLLIEFKYDAAGRTDSILTSLGAYHFGYNSETGTLDTLVSPYGVETRFEYDGSLMTGIHWAGTMAGSVATAYNDEFRVETVTVGGGSPVAYSYDYDGLIDEIGSLQYSWDLSGRLRNRSISDYNDLMNYDAFGQPAEFTAVTGADDTVYQYNLTRDKLGRVREKVETIGGVTHSYQYEYDVTGKLVQVDIDSAFWTGYAYDENGNRLTRSRAATTDTGDYDAQDRLTQYGNQSFVYGRNGELDAKVVLGDTTRYKYDVHGNLLKVAFSTGDSITYLIDGMNRRVTKKVNGATVLNYLYHNASLYPIATTDSIGAVLQRFLYAPGRYSPDQVLVGDTVFILVYDNVGSLRLVVNNTTNAIVQRMDYDEFGATTFDSNPGFTPFGYAGGMYEGAAGLIRFGARDYMPSVGRWATKDPIGFGGGMNQYAYVENDPVNFFDPSGLRPGDRFLTADQAGNDAASWYNGPSQASNVEYGGWIVRNSDGSFSATKGTTQGNPFTVDIGEKPCNGAGWYHTHGASVESSKENHVDWNNRPSPEDREYGADPSVNLPGYLGVPKGPTLKFGPGMKSPTQKWNPSRGGYGNPSL